MFVIINYKGIIMANKLKDGGPRFLTTTFDAHHKDITEKAVAHYMRDNELTPKQFAGK